MAPASSPHQFIPVLLEGGMDMMLLLPIFFAIFYFVLIRPQQREKKAQEAMRSDLKKGDEVMTQSGIIAKIHSIKDNVVTLDLDGTARIRVIKDGILRRVGDPTSAKDAKDAPEPTNGKSTKTNAAAN